jgi:hypothetical protein
MKTFLSKSLLALTLCCFLAGCGCSANRPSAKNNYYTDYVVFQSYVLKQPVFFATKSSFLTKIGDGGEGAFPQTLEEFQKNPAAWDADLLPKGTTLKISGIKYTSSFDAGPWISISAEILDGKLSGKDCSLDFISERVHKNEPQMDVPMIDTNILELITKP